MILNHINLTVSDVAAAAAFLEKYFAMRPAGEPSRGFAALFDAQGLVLTLMKGRMGEVNYPATFHIGFGQPNRAEVDAFYVRLKADGFDVAPPQESHAYTFYVNAPGGFQIEIMA